jgi:hypothetical protein
VVHPRLELHLVGQEPEGQQAPPRVLMREQALPSGNEMQIRSRHSQMPTDAQMAIVRRWASIAGVLVVRR